MKTKTSYKHLGQKKNCQIFLNHKVLFINNFQFPLIPQNVMLDNIVCPYYI